MKIKFLLLIIFFAIFFHPNSYAQSLKENLILKQQIEDLTLEVQNQKKLTEDLMQKLDDSIKKQDDILLQVNQTTVLIKSLGSNQNSLTGKNAFILNKSGKPIAQINDDLKLYSFSNGNLLGWINPDTNEVIRNYDKSVIGIIENNFLIEESGHAVGSIEYSETLKWDREKFYSQVQKTPISHYFSRTHNADQFNLSTFRYSDWSETDLEELLNFSVSKIQKIK